MSERDYNSDTINRAIERAKAVPRLQLLKPKTKQQTNERPVFAVRYDPHLPSIPASQAKHWRSMVNRDQHLKEVFPVPPLTGYKRQRNLRDMLVRAKVPEKLKLYPKRNLKGMSKCNQPYCRICPFVKEEKKIKIDRKESWYINKPVNCNSHNVVYLIECTKENCTNNWYIGETKRNLRYRFGEHRGYVTNGHTDQATGAHYNLPGHSVENMKISIIEKVKQGSDAYRKERELYFINKFNTYYKGINKQH